jgi:GNAT superfamily N-acetyltransferase
MLDFILMTSTLDKDIITQCESLIVSVFLEGEPLTQELKKTYRNDEMLSIALTEYVHCIITDGLKKNREISLVVIDKSAAPPCIAAVCFNDYISDEYHFHTDRMQCLQPIIKVLEKMDKTFFADPVYNAHSDRIMRVHMIAVSPLYTRRGLASDMIDRSIDIARSKGFQALASEATSPYSLQGFLNKKWRINNLIECSSYSDCDVENNEGKVFKDLLAPIQVFDTSRSAVHFVVYDIL